MSTQLALRGVVKSFSEERVLDGLSLDIPAGAITVLMGPSGHGKTTSIRLLLGLLEPDAGDVVLHGESLARMSDADLSHARRRTGVMLQTTATGLFASRTVRESILYALREQRIDPERRRRELADAWLAKVGLARHGDHRPDELSVGMRKRAGLARALAPGAPVVILDAFEGGLDGVRLALLCELVRRAHSDTGCTMLVTTHSVEVAARLADTVAVLIDGRIAASGPPREILNGAHPRSVASNFLGGRALPPQRPAEDHVVVEAAARGGGEWARLLLVAAMLVIVAALIAAQVTGQLEDGGRVLVPY